MGTFDSAGGGSLSLNAERSNRAGLAWVLATQPVTVGINGKTKITRQGPAVLEDLQPGDHLVVRARACKAGLNARTLPALVAKTVVATPATIESNVPY